MEQLVKMVWMRAAICWACCVPSPAHAAEVLRFRCTLLDGSVRIVMQDIALEFAQAVRNCEPVAAMRVPAVPLPLVNETPIKSLVSMPAPPALLPAPLVREAPKPVDTLVRDASRRYRLDYGLLSALIQVESGFQPGARSPKGALGLMQIMPATAARYGVNSPQRLLDPGVNIDVGARYLRDLAERFGGRVELVLAAYNAGEFAVERHGWRIPPYPETQLYVRRIMAMYRPR